jgi:hypothetical protein
MTQPLATSRKMTATRELGRLVPRAFTRTCWWRFAQDRRRGYIRRLGAPPDERQALLISQMVEAEWNKLKTEHEAGTAVGKDRFELMRMSAEWSRQLMLLNRDLVNATPALSPAASRLAAEAAGRTALAEYNDRRVLAAKASKTVYDIHNLEASSEEAAE